ncbi:unnamed protein product [Acidithrix sp. C25]|nr:unnamed protein product [Acidithrix sp. C25]
MTNSAPWRSMLYRGGLDLKLVENSQNSIVLFFAWIAQ